MSRRPARGALARLEAGYGRALEALALLGALLILAMTLMICADVLLRNVRIIPCVVSLNSLTLAGSIGFVKLGQPQPDSNLSDEANSGSPDTTST